MKISNRFLVIYLALTTVINITFNVLANQQSSGKPETQLLTSEGKPATIPLVPQLSELNQLKAEYFKLKIAKTQCDVSLLDAQAKLASSNLSADQQTLEKIFKTELKCNSSDKFDWSALVCVAVEKPNAKTVIK